jgi:transcriptional regulator NrdR
MRCPKCGFRDDKVIDSRQSRDSSSIRRRRVCLQCAYRFTTYETIDRSDLRVIKRDRTHEPFDRRKLVNSLAKACEKRSISLVTLENAVDEIVHEVDEFVDAIQALGRRIKPNALQRELFSPETAPPEMHPASAGTASTEGKHGRV